MPEPIIRVENVTRVYHVGDIDVHALRGVNLTIERGEFVAIMGSSGSGKSTLMSLLGCLDRPTSGDYYFEGVDVARLSEPELARIRSERLGFVFQSFNLLARTSAIENVALPLFYAVSNRSDRASRIERARASLGLLGLGDRERNTPGQLSGGQQQRVAIARALINKPGLLLADEPTGNLDTRTSHDIMQTLQTLNREQGVTIIVVTHEADIAAYADRVITMRDGQVISDERKRPGLAPQAASKAAGLRTATIDTRQIVGRIRHCLGFRRDDPGGGHAGARAQQDAIGAHHVGGIHRSGRAHRHGGRRPRRQRSGPQTDREPRHQPAGGRAGRHHDGRHQRRARQRFHNHCRRRRGGPPRSSARSAV